MTYAASVVIPALNAAETIDDQLAALAAQQHAPEFEVIVADNGSSDGTRARALAWADRLAITVIDASQHRGVSHARNEGLRAASSPVVLFCDGDDVVTVEWVRLMVEALRDHDLVGGPLITSRINTAAEQARTQTPDSTDLPTALRYLPYATGANLGVRRDVALALEGFDPSYVGGHEEVDFAWRLQEAGHSLGWATGAEIDYRLRGSVRAAMRQRYRYGRTSAHLQRRFDRAGMPPATVRRQVRILLSHLTDLPTALRSRDGRAAWLTGSGWALGRLVGMVMPLPPSSVPRAAAGPLPEVRHG